jgi:hypothetical protein
MPTQPTYNILIFSGLTVTLEDTNSMLYTQMLCIGVRLYGHADCEGYFLQVDNYPITKKASISLCFEDESPNNSTGPLSYEEANYALHGIAKTKASLKQLKQYMQEQTWDYPLD